MTVIVGIRSSTSWASQVHCAISCSIPYLRKMYRFTVVAQHLVPSTHVHPCLIYLTSWASLQFERSQLTLPGHGQRDTRCHEYLRCTWCCPMLIMPKLLGFVDLQQLHPHHLVLDTDPSGNKHLSDGNANAGYSVLNSFLATHGFPVGLEHWLIYVTMLNLRALNEMLVSSACWSW